MNDTAKLELKTYSKKLNRPIPAIEKALRALKKFTRKGNNNNSCIIWTGHSDPSCRDLPEYISYFDNTNCCVNIRRLMWVRTFNYDIPKRIKKYCATEMCINPHHFDNPYLDVWNRPYIVNSFKKFIKIDTRSGCWNWTGYTNRNIKIGYGTFVFSRQVNTKHFVVSAHRLSWEIYNKRYVPKNKSVCHKCDNPKCVNPDHLFIGSQRDNVFDMIYKGRKPNKVLTKKEVKQIRDYPMNVKSKILAKHFGVCSKTISEVRGGKCGDEAWRLK